MIRVGIAGCGSIVKLRHAPEYAANKNAEIGGFYDIDIERVNEFAKEFGGVVYRTYDEMLSDKTLDAISICTANKYHSSMTIQALRAGKHVLCEKPMAMSEKEAVDMVNAAKETGLTLMIGHNQRLLPAHKLAKELLEEGMIGAPLTFHTIFSHAGPEAWSVDKSNGTWFFRKGAAGFGSLADLGVHKIDIIRWLLDSEVTKVTAMTSALHKRNDEGNLIDVDDNSITILTMENGVIGSIITSWTNYGEEDNSTVIYGTQGVMEIFTDPVYSIKIFLKTGEKKYYKAGTIQTNTNQTNSGVIDLFVKKLIEHTKTEISGEDALQIMKIVYAIEESSKLQKTVTLNESGGVK